MSKTQNDILALCHAANIDAASCEPVAQQGSSRKYFRITDKAGKKYIGTSGTDAAENRAFIALSEHLSLQGCRVPRVIAVSDDQMTYLQTDVGSTSLYEAFVASDEATRYELLKSSVDLLVDTQSKGGKSLAYDKICYPSPAMDERSIRWDLNYFKYCFLKGYGIEFDESRLENDFDELVGLFASVSRVGLMLRDYQSRNILINDTGLSVIDFQGARRGPIAYDIVSLLWQARLGLSTELRQELAEYYIGRMKEVANIDAEGMREDIRLMKLLRTLQVLGAYGFRGFTQHKPQFISSVRGALVNLKECLDDKVLPIPEYLRSVLTEVVAKGLKEKLTVTVRSFSFKKGRPDDTGNEHGGGYTFDCRGLHNPGRYEEYKHLTGLDTAVADFLARESEVSLFLDHVKSLVDMSVNTYLRRGFDSLTVDFGCTGGQHRSVYCAHALALHLSGRRDVNVIEEHCVQNMKKEYKAL